MQINPSVLSSKHFSQCFQDLLPWQTIRKLINLLGPAKRRPPTLPGWALIKALVYHVLQPCGTLAEHVADLLHVQVSDADLSQRRACLSLNLFGALLRAGLRVKADSQHHPQAFYKGWRLIGGDGSRFSVANTPQVKRQCRKAKARRGRAAFAKVGVFVLLELGLRNPIAAAIGIKDESEMQLAKQSLNHVPAQSLFIADRYYGVGAVIVHFQELYPEGDRHFLLRARQNLKRQVVEVLRDGSALVELLVKQGRLKKKVLVREICGQVRNGRGRWACVRLWTSLLDARAHPARELLRLYASRWEQEIFYKELKIDLREKALLQSHTPLTAGQEIAALILAYVLVVQQRMGAAQLSDVPVLQISFLKTLSLLRAFWQIAGLLQDLLNSEQMERLSRRVLASAAEHVVAKRRKRSCPRAVRQPVSSWPRLLKNTYRHGGVETKIDKITRGIS